MQRMMSKMRWQSNTDAASRHYVIGKLFISLLITAQLLFVFCAQKTTTINMDGIYSYMLANNPYAYVFISGVYDEFPKENGWMKAHTLKENYAVEPYDRFNYLAVYFLQSHDVHPPLYYFALHTICSLFPGTYSNLYALTVNLIALFLADLVLIRLFERLYGETANAAIPILLLMLMEVMFFLCTWARMYMMLFLFCAWYLSIHERMLRQDWRREDMLRMTLCIVFGSLTHYYFYIYAAALTVLMLGFLIIHKRRHELFNYLYAGIVGIAVSWICYPWVLWHIFVNQQKKHTDITPWSLEKVKSYISFLNDNLLNGRGWLLVVFLMLLCLEMAIRKKNPKKDNVSANHQSFRKMTIGSGAIYSFIIFTMDDGSLHYQTALYLSFIVWVSMVLLDLAGEIPGIKKKSLLKIMISISCLILLFSPNVIKRYLKRAEAVRAWMFEGKTLTSDFRQAPKKYKGYDCIYIEDKVDNLFNGYLFEFGEYNQFKKIEQSYFEEHGITSEELTGRGTAGKGIVVYAPKECAFDEHEYRWLVSDNKYSIYEYIGKDIR